MSYSTRASRFANAAFVVTVGPRDFSEFSSPPAKSPTAASFSSAAAGDDASLPPAAAASSGCVAAAAAAAPSGSGSCSRSSSSSSSSGVGGCGGGVGSGSGEEYEQSIGVDTVHPLSGMWFQQFWENRCFEAAGREHFAAPAQRAVDFLLAPPQTTRTSPASNSRRQSHLAAVVAAQQLLGPGLKPNSCAREQFGVGGCDGALPSGLPSHLFMGKLQPADLHSVLPEDICTALENAIIDFSKKIPGLLAEDTLLVGVETRTSSPVRVKRDPVSLQSVSSPGLYPVGEGAGYAGGIMTACVDGVRAAEAMLFDLQSNAPDVDLSSNTHEPREVSRTFQPLHELKEDSKACYPAW